MHANASKLRIVLWTFIIATWSLMGWDFYKRKTDECYQAPKIVEFHQGMTICPGQSATMHIRVPLNVRPKDQGI